MSDHPDGSFKVATPNAKEPPALFQPSTDIMDAEDERQKNALIWYACYGSNLSKARFNCYIMGGRVEGMSHHCVGARDSAPVRDSQVEWMPYRVFFAHISKTWGYGGAAMLDITSSQGHECCMRLYKVTLQQFNDVVAQENDFTPPLPATNQLTYERLVDLKRQGQGAHWMLFEGSFYPAVVYLGERDNTPIVTFTCLPENVGAFLSGELPAAPPSSNYLAVMRKGLQELGMNEAQAKDYWEKRVRLQIFINYEEPN
jgi:histone deacetylase 4/5